MNSKLLRLFIVPTLALSLGACAGIHAGDPEDPYFHAMEEDSDDSELTLESAEIEIASSLKSDVKNDDLKLDEEYIVTTKRPQRQPASTKRRNSKTSAKAGNTKLN